MINNNLKNLILKKNMINNKKKNKFIKNQKKKLT